MTDTEDLPTAAFFDFDGVILESADLKTDAFSKMFIHRGEELNRRFIEHHLANAGRSRYAKFEWAYATLFDEELTATRMELLDRRFTELVDDGMKTVPAVPGAFATLEYLSSRSPCFLVSATPHRDLTKTVEQRGLDRYFKEVCGSPEPKVDNTSHLLRRHSVVAERAVFVGDALADHEAARGNAIPFVGRVPPNRASVFPTDVPCVPNLELSGLLAAWRGLVGARP